jgi:hypothetical protein
LIDGASLGMNADHFNLLIQLLGCHFDNLQSEINC